MIAFSKARVDKVLRAIARRDYWSSPAEVLEREFGANAGAFAWHVFREQLYSPLADEKLFALMASAPGSYTARDVIALLQRLPRDPRTGDHVAPPGPASMLVGFCDALDEMVARAAREQPDVLRATLPGMRGAAHAGAAIALAREGALGRDELPPGLRAVLGASALSHAGTPAFEQARALVFPDEPAYHNALLAAAESAEFVALTALVHLAQTTPPRVWVHVAYHAGAVPYVSDVPFTQLTRLFDAAPPDVCAELSACADRLLRERDEVTPFRLDNFVLGLALSRDAAEEPFAPAHDPLFTAALRVPGPADHARLRRALVTLPPDRREAVFLAALGIPRGGTVLRGGVLTERILHAVSVAPTERVVTAILDAIARWDIDESSAKMHHAMEAFGRWGTEALPHLTAAEARHRDHVMVYRRLARRVESWS